MTATETIWQCSKCLRQHDGAGNVRAAFVSCVPQIGDCMLEDCEAVAARNRQADEERHQRRLERRKRIKEWHRSSPHARFVPPAEARSPLPPERDEVYGEPVEASQDAFESSGAAKTQDEILIKFFSDPATHGKMFPMVYLEEISGARRMNNRAIALRRHFEPLGFGLWNEMRIYRPTGELHSHYGLFPLAEIARKQAAAAAAREAKSGQGRFV